MGRFDSPTEAALAQLKIDQSALSPVSFAVEKLVGIGSKILELAGYQGASVTADLVFGLKGLAAAKDESNLIYFAEALVDDIRRLYRWNEEMRQRVETILKSKEFQEAVANATLYVARTNVETRLKRLARVLANTIKDGNLEPETLDDAMRTAVFLTEKDIEVLRIVYELQSDMLSPENLNKQPGQRANELQRKWQVWWGQHIDQYRGLKGLEFRDSCARLQSEGLVGTVPKSFAASPTRNDLELLVTGLRFYKCLEAIIERR
jgi:hypothetical protein